MSTLVIRLAGPMQAWGDSSHFTRRTTRSEPTKSGVIGLLAAAQGRRRTDPVEDLAELRFAVRVDQPGQLQRDFQTARSMDGTRSMPLSYRYYLSDALFMAAVEGEGALIDALADALVEPVFPLYLGRRSYVPSRPLLVRVVDESAVDVLRSAGWEAELWHRRTQGRVVHLDLVSDASAGVTEEGIETVRDVPVSYDPRRREYGWRDVVREAVRVENPDGRAETDFLAVHGGA